MTKEIMEKCGIKNKKRIESMKDQESSYYVKEEREKKFSYLCHSRPVIDKVLSSE